MGETIARNKKAYHDYEILDKFEAGIELKGSEVKAIRAGRVNLKDSFVKVIKGEAFLFGMHISHVATANAHYAPQERRDRKLLLHKKEIEKLEKKVARDGMSIVGLSVYFNSRNMVKLQIALAKGKDLHDKREALKQKDAKRETARAIKDFRNA
ncbi:MAG: SsrA-binding protein SmpB [Campylobacteraceae bacterium]|nr:SsrA-binding protein SmpB [Campylobacteraceae bacterium]